jgi:sugar lactone lactonase YvrE
MSLMVSRAKASAANCAPIPFAATVPSIILSCCQHRGIEGMCLDADGNIVAVGGWQRSGPGPLVYVFRPDGAVTETHPIPADLPNKCCFGGRDLDLFYVTTAGGCLYQARTAREGLSRR